VVTVQRALGHSSPTVTLNTYAHLWPTAEDRTRAGAAATLAEVLGRTDEPLTNDDAA
jgi:integrase